MNDLVFSSAKINSIANKTPPRGALNAVVIAAAAPQPTIVLVSSTVFPVRCPISEARVDDTTTIGPTRPNDIPVPTLVIAATHFAKPCFALNLACLKATDSMTRGTPTPFASFDQYSIINPAISPPSAGIKIISQGLSEPRMSF